MFGELIGLSLVQAWIDQGRPTPFTLAEAGPGRGTLLADLLRATTQVPGFLDAAEIVLIEASHTLRAVQAETLAAHAPKWLDTVEELPEQPLFFVANEFFDALPIRQFQRDGTQWRERQIGLVEGNLQFGLGPAQPQPALDYRNSDTKDGDLVEDCPAATPIIDMIGQRIARHGGVGLIIDYGDWRSLGDTLQAVKAHEPQDPLRNPGDADLTAHVDFEALAQAAPCQHTKLTPQGVFLERLGITPRAQTLAKKLTGEALDQLVQAHRRLTHPDEMGQLFKVLGLYPEGQTPPPGLDA
jgi:SAM-dependent MidA family methyltransferase